MKELFPQVHKIDSGFLSKRNVEEIVTQIEEFGEGNEITTIISIVHTTDGKVGVLSTRKINPLHALGLLSYAHDFYLTGGSGWSAPDPRKEVS